MDRAKNRKNILAPSILASELKKAEKDNYEFICPNCGEEVFYRGGLSNAPCFAHFSAMKAEKEAECKSRVKQFEDLKKDIKGATEIKNWLQQISDENQVYNLNFPKAFHNEKKVWQAIAELLIEEIKIGKYLVKSDFEYHIANNSKITTSSITLYFDDIGLPKEKVVEFYWNIFLRIRSLYNNYNLQRSLVFDQKYLDIFKFIEKKLGKIESADFPFIFWYDEEANSLNCKQELKDSGLNNRLDISDFPNINYKQCSNKEIVLLKQRNYIVAVENFFGSVGFVSTNRQIKDGEHILIIGNLSVLEKMGNQLKNFSDNEKVLIIKNITGLSPSCGVIELVIKIPDEIPTYEYPSWLDVVADLKFIGGLKLKNRDKPNSFLSDCPPLISIKNIPSELIEIKDSFGNNVSWERIDNKILFKVVPLGEIIIRIVDTPYSRTLNIEEPIGLNISMPSKGWLLNNNWPSLAKVDNNNNCFVVGPILIGEFIQKSNLKTKKESEWMHCHSGIVDLPNFGINKLLAK